MRKDHVYAHMRSIHNDESGKEPVLIFDTEEYYAKIRVAAEECFGNDKMLESPSRKRAAERNVKIIEKVLLGGALGKR